MCKDRPSRHEVMMDIAYDVSQRGTCNRAKVGAVIARDARVVSTGYNGAPSGVPHCPPDEPAGCTHAIHAEANAIVYAARTGVSTEGCILYSTTSPCVECAKIIVNAGIKEVWFDVHYRLSDGINYLRGAGVKCEWLV